MRKGGRERVERGDELHDVLMLDTPWTERFIIACCLLYHRSS